MSLLKRMLIILLSSMTGNKFSQRLMQKIVFISQYLMGIGSGSGVSNSGEQIQFKIYQKIAFRRIAFLMLGQTRDNIWTSP